MQISSHLRLGALKWININWKPVTGNDKIIKNSKISYHWKLIVHKQTSGIVISELICSSVGDTSLRKAQLLIRRQDQDVILGQVNRCPTSIDPTSTNDKVMIALPETIKEAPMRHIVLQGPLQINKKNQRSI